MSIGEAEKYNEKGKELSKSGKIDEALNCFLKASELCPQEGKYMYNIGSTYKEQKRYSESAVSYIKALELGFKPELTVMTVGNSLCMLKEYDLAAEYFTIPLNENPYNHEARYSRALAYNYNGKYQDALDDLNIILAEKPYSKVLLLLRGDVYKNLGMHDKAYLDLERAEDPGSRSTDPFSEI